MSSVSKAWIVVASVGAVEVLKYQGIYRWNYVLRSLHQHNKGNMRSFLQAKNASSSSSPAAISSVVKTIQKVGDEKLKQSEESLRKVMYLSCWGPN
ncbi:uncharacterized protein LOC122084021 [Macadamia integrifolia]|uniref:uncharacterized protein LOC122084021 n=1 Tax=Macadamia integrifolia TaxID=60698 RepID=UPI001C4E5DC4|nr:uncharacterized protein LOC122084021 [Macadamia integrifolia]